MKISILPLVIVFCVTLSPGKDDKPIAGKSYSLEYDPAVTGLLTDAGQIQVVYAFDVWGAKVAQKLRDERGEGDLFQNVLQPDSGRAHILPMRKKGPKWQAKIPIPSTATLLSYYFSNDVAANKWDRAKLAEYAEQKGVKWRQVLDDPQNTIHTLYEIRFWPNLFLIDPQGNVLQREGLRGEELEKTLSRLLEEKL